MRFKGSWLVSLLALTVVALSGCGGQAPAGKELSAGGPRKGGVLKVAIIGNPPTLDIHLSTTSLAEQVTFNMYETLFALDSKFVPQPMLADSYRWENESKRLVVALRQGVLFHNGKEMTSEDAVASINRWLKVSSLGKQLSSKVAAVKAEEKYSLAIELKAPLGTLVAALANPNNQLAIMPKEIVEPAGDKPVSQFIGTGPYKFAEFAQDRYVRLVRFDEYKPRTEPADGYAGKKSAYVDEIQYIPVPEAQTREAGLQTGEYQYAVQVPQDHYDTLKVDASLDMVVVKPAGWTTLVFNKKKGLFTDVRLRQAVNRAIDPAAVMKAAYGNADFFRLDASLAPKEGPFWNGESAGQYNQRDLAAAQRLLKEAGYDGTPVRLLTTKEYDYQYKTAIVTKGNLEEAGFKVDLQVVDWATLVQRRSNPDLYDIFTTAILFSPLPTAQNVFLSPSWPGWWENAEVQKQLDRFNATADPTEQKAAWNEIQRIYWQEIPVIHLGDYFGLNAKRKELHGYQSTPHLFFWNTWLN